MDLIIDLIDQLIELRIKQSRDPDREDYNHQIAVLKERLRLVLVENIDH